MPLHDRAAAVGTSPMSLWQLEDLARRFSAGETHLLQERFRALTAQVESESEWHGLAVQDREMPVGFGVDEFVRSWGGAKL